MIFAGICDGEVVELKNALSVEINQEIGIPADDMTVVFAYTDDLSSLQRIYAIDSSCDDIEKAIEEKDVLFSGVVDEVILTADTNSATVTVYARSLAALLLDNECRPAEYVNPSLEVIYLRHLKPFGISIDSTNLNCKSGTLTLHKGSSHYKALESFCENHLGTSPRIDCRGVCRTQGGDSDKSLDFDNTNGITFEYVSVCDNRYNRISRVYVNTSGKSYDTAVSDSVAESLGIVRERYLSLMNSKTGTLSDGDEIIENGKNSSFSVVVKSGECLINKLGCKASVNIPQCYGKEFVVTQIKYTANSKGENTRIKLSL